MEKQTFWQGRRVFITGHTGFKGSWLSLWLESLGARVAGYSLEPPTSPSLFREARVASGINSRLGDICGFASLQASISEFNPEIIFHLAAQPLVRASYRDPVATYAANVMGTVNLLQAARGCSDLRSLVVVTSDKCYENREWDWGYRESDPMGGHDPYSSSKACAELVCAAYQKSFFAGSQVSLATARAGNVIGGGDWAEDRLVPDILRNLEREEVILLRNPRAVRPWQHVLEPLGAYLLLAERLSLEGEGYASGWNFGPADEDAREVAWIAQTMCKEWGREAQWTTVNQQVQPHEAGCLKLDSSRARSRLGWRSAWSLEKSLSRIVRWHRRWRQGEDARLLCLEDIAAFTRDCQAAEAPGQVIGG